MHQILLTLVSILLFLGACRSSPPIESNVTDSQQEIIDYFVEIAIGMEFGTSSQVTRKWTAPMRLFVEGKATKELLEELDQVMQEINELASDGFSMSRVDRLSQSNFHIYLGRAAEYVARYPEQRGYAKKNWGLVYVYWNDASELYKGHMYVDITRADPTEAQHLLREELTQSLGLAKDSQKYQNSIFQQDWTHTTEYAAIDRELIRLLYHPKVKPGLRETQVREVLSEIRLEE